MSYLVIYTLVFVFGFVLGILIENLTWSDEKEEKMKFEMMSKKIKF